MNHLGPYNPPTFEGGSTDNKFKFINFGVATPDVVLGQLGVAKTINNLDLNSELLTVSADEIPVFFGVVFPADKSPENFKGFYVVNGKGKGTYGLNGTIQLAASDLERIEKEETQDTTNGGGFDGGLIEIIETDPNAHVENLGEIGTENIIDHLNANHTFVIGAKTWYFDLTRNGKRLFYIFTGNPGTYGFGATPFTTQNTYLMFTEAMPNAGKIEIEGISFDYRPNPTNDGGYPLPGDIALNNFNTANVFASSLKLGAGDPFLFSSWYNLNEDLTNNIIIQPELNTNTVLTGSQKGLNKLYPVNSDSDISITVNKGTYQQGDVVNFKRRGVGGLAFNRGENVRLEGYRSKDNIHRLTHKGNLASVIFDRLDGDVLVGSVIGDISKGYSGAVSVFNYDKLREGDIDKNITVNGTGFSENMLVSVSENALQTSPFTFVSNNEIILHLTATGIENETINVTFDNGDVFIDLNAIIIESKFIYNNHTFDYGWALFKLKSSQLYALKARRSSDDGETDVGFDSFGKVSLDSPVSVGGNLSDWAGNDDVFVTKRYNQGDAVGDFDLTQTDPLKQAKLLIAGALIIKDGRVLVEFDGSDDFYETIGADDWGNNDLTIFADVRVKTSDLGLIVGNFSDDNEDRVFQHRYNTDDTILSAYKGSGGVITVSPTVSVNSNIDTVFLANSSVQKTCSNGFSGSTKLRPSTLPNYIKTIREGRLSSQGINCQLNGFKNYVIIFKTNESENISIIESLINTGI